MHKLIFSLILSMTASSLFSAENLMSVGYGDLIFVGKGSAKVDTEDKIKDTLEQWHKIYNCDIVVWRITDDIWRNYEHYYIGGWANQYWEKEKEIRSRFDPNKAGRQISRDLKLPFYLNISFLDHGWPHVIDGEKVTKIQWQDKLTIAHPEYQDMDRNGKYFWGSLDLSNEDARKAMVSRITGFAEEFDAEGIYLNSRVHTGYYLKNLKAGYPHGDQYGFGPAIVKEYQKRYGIDITKDSRFDCKSSDFLPASPEVENWRKLRGEYFLEFYRELKAALNGRKLLLTLPLGNYMGAPHGNIYVNHQKIIDEKLADAMLLGISSGYIHKGSLKKLGYLCSEAWEDNYNVPTIDEYLSKYGKKAKDNNIKLYHREKLFTRERDTQVTNNPYLTGVIYSTLPTEPTPYISDSPQLQVKGPLTIESWVKVGDIAKGFKHTTFTIASKYAHEKRTERGWGFLLERDKDNTLKLVFRTQLRQGAKALDIVTKSNIPVPKDKWVHLAGVFDPVACEKRLYIDGVLAGTDTIPANCTINSNPGINLVIGSYAGSYTSEFYGLIDEIRLSSRPLTFEKIPEEYSGKEPGTLALLRFNGSFSLIGGLSGLNLDNLGVMHYAGGRNNRKALDLN